MGIKQPVELNHWQSFVEDHKTGFVIESWTLLVLGTIVVALRFVSRIKRSSWRGLRWDDGLTAFSYALFVLAIATLKHIVSRGAQNINIPRDALAHLSAAEIKVVEDNSKWVFVLEHAMLYCIFGVKFCMLAMYWHITVGLWMRNLVKASVAISVLCLFGAHCAMLFTCLPVPMRWTAPARDADCGCYYHYQIAGGVMSNFSSLMNLIVGLTIVWTLRRSHLPPRQKLVTFVLFALGIFDIACSVLGKYYVLHAGELGVRFMSWYVREVSVAILVGNLPYVWSLICDLLPSVRRWAEGSSSSQRRLLDHPTFWERSKRHWIAGKVLGSEAKAEIEQKFAPDVDSDRSHDSQFFMEEKQMELTTSSPMNDVAFD